MVYCIVNNVTYEIWITVICADIIYVHMYKANVTDALDLCKKYLRSSDVFYFVLDSVFYLYSFICLILSNRIWLVATFTLI